MSRSRLVDLSALCVRSHRVSRDNASLTPTLGNLTNSTPYVYASPAGQGGTRAPSPGRGDPFLPLPALGLVVCGNAVAVAFLNDRVDATATRARLEAFAGSVAQHYATLRASAGALVRARASMLDATVDPQVQLDTLHRPDGELLWLLDNTRQPVAAVPLAASDAWPLLDTGIAQDQAGLISWEGRPFLVSEQASVSGDTTLAIGIDIGRALDAGLLASQAQSVRVVLERPAQQSASTGAALPSSIVLPLDRFDDVTLVAHINVAAVPATRWTNVALAAWNLVLAALAGLLYLLCERMLRRRDWHTSLAALERVLTRARDGDADAVLQVPAQHPLAPLAPTVNDVLGAFSDRLHELEHQHKYDALTGLATRAEVRERIARAVDNATTSGTSVAAVIMDVARFGEINSTFGHEAGDELLKMLARRLARVTRIGDTAARVGGDEFMLLLADVDAAAAMQLVQPLIAALEESVVIDGKRLALTVRAGVALYPDHCDGARSLRRMANIALLTAKESRQPCVLFEPGQDEQHLRELAIIHDLPAALRDDELYLQYQPKIDMESQQVHVVEALVRWRHPQLGFVPPDEFIGLLERAGQIQLLTRWVFNEAIRQVREWMDAGYDLSVAVNISANDLLDETLPLQVGERLRHYAVAPSRLSIEVTESAVIADPERAISILKDFKRAGIKIALDDFGTGQTSLSLLKQLPLSQVKIDKSFVQHLRADSGDAIIVKSIIDLGHNMGLLVTAEGVESNYCWNLLNSYGCDLVQGYLVSAPLTADELRKWYLRLQQRHVNRLDYEALNRAG